MITADARAMFVDGYRTSWLGGLSLLTPLLGTAALPCPCTDDFDASSHSSRLKVELSDRTLTVSMDPRNTQTWTDCTEVRPEMVIPSEEPFPWHHPLLPLPR